PDAEVEQPAPRQQLAQAAPELNHARANDVTMQTDDNQRALLPEVTASNAGEVVYAQAGERALLMPDLRGTSVRDAARVCAQLGLELEAQGEGRAMRQSPEAGARIESGQVVRIDFGRSD